MELRVLRYFLSVAGEGSITAAANALHITQPTLSRQMQELEKELGCRLFVRGSHNVRLTTAGMLLRKRAEEIVEMVGKTKEEVGAGMQQVAGEVYIGGGETQGMRIIAEVIKAVRRDYPQIKFHLYSGNAEDVTERLDKGLLDYGILIQPTDLSKYDFIHMPVKDRWGIVMRKDNPLASRSLISKTDLRGLPLICSRQLLQGGGKHNEFLRWFGEDMENLNIVSTYNLLFNATLLVEQGIGCALTLDKLINAMDNGNVCFRPLAPELKSGLDIVWKKNQFFSAAAKVFAEYLQKRLDMDK